MPPPERPFFHGRKMARIIAKGSLKPYAQKAFERFFRLPETRSGSLKIHASSFCQRSIAAKAAQSSLKTAAA